MKNISIWKDNYKETNYKELNKDIEVDVLIIGGGITGISSLFYLKDSNLKVALVEQNKIGLSTTGNSTGKLTYLQNDLTDKQKKYYAAEVENVKNEVDKILEEGTFTKNKMLILSLLTKLRQICISPKLVFDNCDTASFILFQSLFIKLPVRNLNPSNWPKADNIRIANCSALISKLNTATDFS